MKKPRILILSASTGNGHVTAANAIADEANSRGLHAVHVDTLDFCPKAYKVWYAGGYEMLVRRKPSLWGYFYEASDKPGALFDFQAVLDTTMCDKIAQLVEKEKPDWVVCTHSLPQPKLAELRKKHGFKMAIVVTDLWPHAMWLRGDPDRFFVPQTWSKEELLNRDDRFRDRVEVVGMPVHMQFGNQKSKTDSRKELGMPETGSLVTIVSGGIGGGPMVPAVRALTQSSDRVIAIAGRNKALHKRLIKAFQNDPQVTVWGNTPQDRLAMAMAASDLLVSKPGGLTTFESLAVGVPMVVFWPFLIPGQEEGNARFLVDTGCGAIANNLKELVSTTKDLLNDPIKLSAMIRACSEQAIPDATRRIVDSLVRSEVVAR